MNHQRKYATKILLSYINLRPFVRCPFLPLKGMIHADIVNHAVQNRLRMPQSYGIGFHLIRNSLLLRMMDNCV